MKGISPERKLDILGIILALIGLLSLLSLISNQRSAITGMWVGILYRLAGLGAFILPLALIVIGLWFVFRNIERLPMLSAERLVGSVLIFVNVLTVIHLIMGGGWNLAADGSGGGYLGALFERILVDSIGVAGAVVALIAWFLIGIIFTLDLSIPELWHQARAYLRISTHGQGSALQPHIPGLENKPPEESGFQPIQSLPAAFRPLSPLKNLRSAVKASHAAVEENPEEPPEADFSPAPVSFHEGPASPLDALTTQSQLDWELPAIDLILDPLSKTAVQASSDEDRARLIEETLTSFGAPAHVVEIHRGPTITQFGVEPDFIENRSGRTRVRVSKIVNLADDLALALAAPRIRIQAPVPGQGYLGIEVPNTEISRVSLRDILESESFQKLRSPLRFALGKDVAGKPIGIEMPNMPHLLIAGTTGSGKSVCVNAILCCLLMNNSPADLRLVLVDPKRVELTGYNGIPHLLAPVVVDASKVVGALQWMMREMDSRYHKFANNGVRNIQEYNDRFPENHLPYVVVVIDELADLMMLAPEETERSITRLAQLARATGIHLILATQRPSVDVVTGLIKANFPARVAFSVASGVDSRVILDQPGAERLLGRGDMLFQSPDAAAPVRLQGVYVADHEIQRLVDYWLDAARNLGAAPSVAGGPVDTLPAGVPLKQVPLWDEGKKEDGDPMMQEAIELVRREGRASITMLQRRLRIGYTRAARLIDGMEEKNIIGPPQPNVQIREVLDYGQTVPPAEE